MTEHDAVAAAQADLRAHGPSAERLHNLAQAQHALAQALRPRDPDAARAPLEASLHTYELTVAEPHGARYLPELSLLLEDLVQHERNPQRRLALAQRRVDLLPQLPPDLDPLLFHLDPLHVLARLHRRDGDLSTAAALHTRLTRAVLDRYPDHDLARPDVLHHLTSHLDFADDACDRGHLDLARAAATEVLHPLERLPDPHCDVLDSLLRAHRLLAHTHWTSGDLASALPHQRTAADLAERIHAHVDTRHTRDQLCQVLLRTGELLRRLDDLDAAEDVLLHALTVTGPHPQRPDTLTHLHLLLGHLQRAHSRWPEALDHYLAATRACTDLVHRPDPRADDLDLFVQASGWVGHAESQQGLHTPAADTYARTLAACERACELGGETPSRLRNLSVVLSQAGDAALLAQDPHRGLRLFERSQTIRARLIADHGPTPSRLRDQASAWTRIERAATAAGDPSRAATARQQRQRLRY